MASEELTGSRTKASSHVRESELSADDERVRSRARVEELFAALGLTEPARNAELASEVVRGVETRGPLSPAEAVREAQARVALFETALFGERAKDVQPIWWRSFIEAHPGAFLGGLDEARDAVARFGDPFEGVAPRALRFGSPMDVDGTIPRWARFMAFPAALTLGAAALVFRGFLVPRTDPLAVVFLGLFTLLFGLTAMGFTTALIGFVAGFKQPKVARSEGPLPRTCVLVPIYNEDAEQVFAGVLAMRESVLRTGFGENFEIIVLSDTRNVLTAADEERAFRRAAAAGDGRLPIFYRRRTKNERQKAGNLAEFFERYGDRYRYAIVLDADSLMRGETWVEMVRRMEAAPNVALMQAPLMLHKGQSLFSRQQQLVASVCGPLFMRGLSVWAGNTGNYYGHNAIMRVGAFVEHCALPILRGEPPLGGHILSHDFVEAALLCRAGFDVQIAHDLTGSWEEMPQALHDYVARDRRWCQGNLQHLKLALSTGFRPMSRLHMLVGAFAFLASPIWLVFVIVSVALALRFPEGILESERAVPVLITTLVLLFLPRFLGLLETMRNADKRRAHGGAWGLSMSITVDTIVGILLAPIMMIHHTQIVASIVGGRAVRWAGQNRGARSELVAIMRSELFTTCLGVAAAVGAYFLPVNVALWLVPLVVPWLLSIPLALALSSSAVGGLARNLGVFLVASETEPDELAHRVEDFRALTCPDDTARFRDVVLDPVLNRAHLAMLLKAREASPLDAPPKDIPDELRERAARGGPTSLSAREQSALLNDPDSLTWLHSTAWQFWPVETWGLSRLGPQLPPPARE
jgi:membrane glycosyltransferase